MRYLATGLSLLFLAACAEPPEASPRTAIDVRDSAGVTVVDLGRDAGHLTTHGAELELAYRVGEEGSGLELFRVAGARLLPSGELAIANAGTPEIVVVDGDGRLVRRLGGGGEGPGEFGTITSIHVEEDGSVLVYDDRNGRLTRFAPSGELAETRRMAEPSPVADLEPLIASAAGPVLAVHGDNRLFDRRGVHRDTTPLLRFTAGSMRPDTLSRWAARASSFAAVGRGVTRAPVPFGPDILASGRAGRAALADTHEPRVSVLDPEGELVMSIHWEEAPREVSVGEYEEWREIRRAELPDEIPEAVRRTLLEVPHHETHAVLDGLFIDGEGGVWIAPTRTAGEGERTWIRVGPDGEARGAAVLPVSSRILDATGGSVAVLERDGLGVETIAVYGTGEPEA